MCIYIYYTRVKGSDDSYRILFFTGWCCSPSLGLLRLSSSYLIWEDWWLDHPDPIGISFCVSSKRVDMRNATSLPLQLPLWRPQDDARLTLWLRPQTTPHRLTYPCLFLLISSAQEQRISGPEWGKLKNTKKFVLKKQVKLISYSFPWKSPAVSLFH
jgi:hypothetical protein